MLDALVQPYQGRFPKYKFFVWGLVGWNLSSQY